MLQMKPSQLKRSLLYVCLVGIAVCFQNCGQAGDIQLVQGEMPSKLGVDYAPPQVLPAQTPETPSNPQPPVVIPTPTPTPTPTPVDPVPPPIISFNVNITKHSNFVCEPFGGGMYLAKSGPVNEGTDSTSTVVAHGLKASLAFVSPENSLQEDFAESLLTKDYWTNSSSLIQKSSTPLFFSQINTVPMSFDQGFSIGNNQFLSDQNGNKLIEWFGLRYETELGLSDEDEPGYYKLATVSDDGVRIEALIGTSWVEILTNDGIHAPKFQCQKNNSALYLDGTSRVKLRIYYYQGPRVMIANVLMFKYLGANAPSEGQSIAGCNLNGNTQIYTSPSDGPVVGTSKYTELINAGWVVIPPRNYFLTNGESNPCAQSQLTLVNLSSEEYKIEGIRNVNNQGLDFKFMTSLVSTATVKVFDDSGTAPVLVESVDSTSSMVAINQHSHSIRLTKLVKGKSYRMEILYTSSVLHISNTGEYLINPSGL